MGTAWGWQQRQGYGQGLGVTTKAGEWAWLEGEWRGHSYPRCLHVQLPFIPLHQPPPPNHHHHNVLNLPLSFSLIKKNSSYLYNDFISFPHCLKDDAFVISHFRGTFHPLLSFFFILAEHFILSKIEEFIFCFTKHASHYQSVM